MRTNREAAHAALGAIESYQEQARSLMAERAEVQRNVAGLQARLDATLQEVAIHYLPDLDEATVGQASRRTGFRGIVDSYRQAQDQQRDRLSRIAEIEADPDFKLRDILIHPSGGTLASDLAEAKENYLVARNEKERIEEHSLFSWVQEDHAAERPKGWRLWLGRILIFGLIRELAREGWRTRLIRDLGFSSVEECLSKYQSTSEAHDHWLKEAARRLKRQNRLTKLVEEQAKLIADSQAHPQTALDGLRTHITLLLRESEGLQELRAKETDELRPLITTIIVLREKIAYLSRMADFLRSEALQRESVANKITSVRRKWSRRPGKSLRGDKTEWLINGPARKAQSTDRQIAQIHSMRTGIYQFEDYVLYDRLLNGGNPFLPFDVFARCSDVRMPGQSFVCQVIPHIVEFREDHGDPDYRAIDEASRDDSLFDGLAGVAVGAAVAAGVATFMDWNDASATEPDSGLDSTGSDVAMEDVS